MIPDHIILSIASFLNFSFIVHNFPHLFKSFAKHNKTELFHVNDLEVLIKQQYDNLFIRHLVYHFKPSEEDNDKIEYWLITHKIKGDIIEISFVWKGKQLLQIASICSRFRQVKVSVHSHRFTFKWNLNVLGNVFFSMKNKQCSFILNGGSLQPHTDCYVAADIIQKLTLNNVYISPNYNVANLSSKVKEFLFL